MFKDPPRWSGHSYAGRPFSECSPSYLQDLASFLNWKADMADKEGKVTARGKPVAPFDWEKAGLAALWAGINARMTPKAIPGDDVPFSSDLDELEGL